MGGSLIPLLNGMLDRQEIRHALAAGVGAPYANVTHALDDCIAIIAEGTASRASDAETLKQVFVCTVSVPPSGIPVPELVAAGMVGSPFAATTLRFLSVIFEGRWPLVSEVLARRNGLPAEAGDRVLETAALMVLACLSRRVRDHRLSLTRFSELLVNNDGAIADGRAQVSLGATTGAVTAAFVPLLILAAVLIGLAARHFGYQTGGTKREEGMNRNRAAQGSIDDSLRRRLPANGAAGRLLAFIEKPHAPGESSEWVPLPGVSFEKGSAIPEAESSDEFGNIASFLHAFPSTGISIAGYVDGKGEKNANARLAENRAEAVRRELRLLGISTERIRTETLGPAKAPSSAVFVRLMRR